MPYMTYAASITQALQTTSREDAYQWLQQALARLAASDDCFNELAILSARARRMFGDDILADDATVIDCDDGAVDVRNWDAATAARVVLILTAIARSDRPAEDIVIPLYQHGDERERAAITRGLSLFGHSAALLPVALESGRANSLLLLSSLIVSNPFPARHYSEQQFNQMVLKSLFTGINIELIDGLQARANVELARMCEDYVQERLDAGRSVPPDIWLAIGSHATPRGNELLRCYMQQGNAEHRHYAALALKM